MTITVSEVSSVARRAEEPESNAAVRPERDLMKRKSVFAGSSFRILVSGNDLRCHIGSSPSGPSRFPMDVKDAEIFSTLDTLE